VGQRFRETVLGLGGNVAPAEVLSADAFSAFEEAGLDDDAAVREVGQRFRETVLGLGGSVAPAVVFRRFRGRDPDVQALLKHNGLAG